MQIHVATSGRAGNYAKIALVDAKLMTEVGDFALSLIRRRTTAGKDIEGVAFQELSPGYAAQKQKELGNSRADLTVSGRMLNEMGRLKVTEKSVTIGFSGGGTGGGGSRGGGTLIQRSRAVAGADKALFHNVTGAGKSHVKRKFFGLTTEERELIRDRVQAFVTRRAKGNA
jgi:hypothetical protein